MIQSTGIVTASTPNMSFNLHIKVKMEPTEEMMTRYYIIEFHWKIKIENETVIEQSGVIDKPLSHLSRLFMYKILQKQLLKETILFS